MIRAFGAKSANEHDDRACAQQAVAARTCIVTRATRSPDHLIRFGVAPDGTVTPDIARKLPGRGVWVTCRREHVEAARAGAFARSLRAKVTVPGDLADRVDALLIKRALALLSICNKAGLVATGSVKVNTWMEAGADGALVQAVDASPDGLARVARKYRAIRSATGRRPVEVTLLTISELSLAIGRSNVVHAVVSDGTAAENFLAAISRIERYRSAHDETPALDGLSPAHDRGPTMDRNTG